MNEATFENQVGSATSTVRVNLLNGEYQILKSCYEQAGEPRPSNKRLSHNSAFKDWARMAVLHGQADPSEFTVPKPDWESDSFYPGDFVFVSSEMSKLKKVDPSVEQFRKNGQYAHGFREVLQEFLEGITYE